MFPLRGMGVFCCDHVADGRDAMATPEATVLSTSRRENGVIAARVYWRLAAKETFSFSSRLSRIGGSPCDVLFAFFCWCVRPRSRRTPCFAAIHNTPACIRAPEFLNL